MKRWHSLRIGLWACVYALLLGATSTLAQAVIPSTTAGPVTLPNTEFQQIHSQISNQDYTLFVALPPDYSETNKYYPALYLLDAQYTFGTVTEYTRRMSVSYVDELPELIVVGIGYPTDVVTDIVALRAHDFTPSVVGDSDQSGGAASFLSFMTEELFPSVEAMYRIDPHDRGLVGHSLGGLFTLYALLTKPDSFQHYVASSPSLWWDSQYLFDYEEAYAQSHSSLDTRLFISAGSLETDPVIPIAEDVRTFAELLIQRHYDGLELSIHIFENETHVSVLPSAFTMGIRLVYDRVSGSS